MLVVMSMSLLALLLTYLENVGIKGSMKLGFIIITILGCIHYDYGNDYMAYYKLYQQISAQSFEINNIFYSEIFHDRGWVILNYLFKPIGGFFMLVAVLNILQNVIIYNFIKNNVNLSWRVFAVFVYLFSTNLYLLNFSMMRQGLVVALFLYAWQFIRERRWIVSGLIVLFASFIHTSALILLPFIFWAFLPLKNGKFVVVVLLIIMLVFTFYNETVIRILDNLLAFDYFQIYAERYGDNNLVASKGVGYVLNLLPLFVAIFYIMNNSTTESDRCLVMMFVCSYVLMPFSSVISTIGRVGIYFSAFGMVVIPLVYSKIRSLYLKVPLISIFVLMTLYDYWLFFHSDVYGSAYAKFHTIFEVL